MKNLILVLFTLISFTVNKDSVFINDDGIITVIYDVKRNTKTFIVRKNFERENIIFLDCTKKEDEDER